MLTEVIKLLELKPHLWRWDPPKPDPIVHLTVIDRRRDRRIIGNPGSRHNVCGAAPTDRDAEWGDFKRTANDPRYKDQVCPKCRQMVRISEALKVGDRVIEKDHHGDTGTLKAFWPDEDSGRMMAKVGWDNGTVADYHLDDLEQVMPNGQPKSPED